jgi:2-hydroxychromene-2-carboxylate isomerase
VKTLSWYFDFISPYAYLQCVRFPALPPGFEVRPTPVLFGALLDHAGTLGPAEIPAKREFTYRQALWLGQKHGVALRLPARHPFNPLPALRLAVALGAQVDTVRHIFDFIWGEGRDPSDPAEFSALAAELGVADAEARIADPAVKSRLKTNTEQAIAAGVWGVPTFALDGLCFWGFDAGDMLLDYLADPARFSAGDFARVATLPVGIERNRKK